MLIKNQALLKRPWIFTLATAGGALIGFVQTGDFDFALRIAGTVGAFILLNVWFFLTWRRTKRLQQNS